MRDKYRNYFIVCIIVIVIITLILLFFVPFIWIGGILAIVFSFLCCKSLDIQEKKKEKEEQEAREKRLKEEKEAYRKSPEYINKQKYGYEEPNEEEYQINKEIVLEPKEQKIYNEDMEYYNPNDLIFIDTETTGLKANDEMLELAIVDYNGNVLFNERLKPKHRRKWEEAEAIHGISPADVKGLPTIEKYRDQLEEIFNNKIVVGYNINFDYKFILKEELIHNNFRTIDVMKAFAVTKGQWSEWKNDYRWQKLGTCARYYKYKWEGEAHSALADTKATAYCFKQMKNCSLVKWTLVYV